MESDQDERINRTWNHISLVVWLLISGLLILRAVIENCRPEQLGVVFVIVPGGLLCGGVFALVIVALPLRLLLNLAQPERRRKYFWETVACIFAFVSLVVMLYAFFTLDLG